MTRNNTIQQNTGGFINRLLSEEKLLNAGRCIVTNEKAGIHDSVYVFLDLGEGLRCYKVWLKKEYLNLRWHERRQLIKKGIEKFNTKTYDTH